MAKDNQIAVRINDRTHEAVQEFANEYELNQAEAVRRMIEARLAGEGYLSGPTVADGGIIEQVSDDLEDIKDQQEDLDQSLEKRSRDRFLLNSLLVVSVIWLATAVTIGFGTIATIVSGLALMGSLVYLYFQ